MTTPAILFNDVPRIHFWGSTAPEEDGPHSPSALIEEDGIIMERDEGGGPDKNAEDDIENDTEDGYMETIFADSSLDEFVMIPANIYGERQDHARIDSLTKRESSSSGSSTDTEGKNDSVLRTFLSKCRSYMNAQDSTQPQHDKENTTNLGSKTGRWAPPRSSTIYSSYDWVSEVVVDEEGRRLILPGQVVVMGEESQGNGTFSDCHSQPLSSAFEPGSEDLTAGTTRRTDFSSLFETSTIMLSAYDLLATQNEKHDKLEFEQTTNRSVLIQSSMASRGYHTASMSTKITGGLRRFAVQRFDQFHHNLVHTTFRLTNGVASQLQKVETRFRILATVSDIAIQGCDWLFPTPLRELEDGAGAPTDPISDAYVSIEMAMLETNQQEMV